MGHVSHCSSEGPESCIKTVPILPLARAEGSINYEMSLCVGVPYLTRHQVLELAAGQR